MDTTAKILGKGLQDTGITEEISETAYKQLLGGNGVKKLLCVVELIPQEYGGKHGQHSVKWAILSVEPAMTAGLEDHLRELMRGEYADRELRSADGQLAIETAEDLEPKTVDVMAAQKALLPHDYQAVGPDLDQCDVCGDAQAAPKHHITAEDPFLKAVPDLVAHMAPDPTDAPTEATEEQLEPTTAEPAPKRTRKARSK